MKHNNSLTHVQGTRTRRRPLVLLAAVAVTLGAIATPLAGTADAGGLTGGVVGSRAATGEFGLAGNTPGWSGGDRVPGDSIDLAGSKAGVGIGN